MATMIEVAEHLDITRQMVGELVRKGVIPKRKHGKHDIDEVRKLYIRHLREVAAGRSSSDKASYDLTTERAREAKEKADKLEMENKRRRGELLNRADVDEAVINAFARVRARMLNVAPRLAPQVLPISEVQEAHSLIERSIHEALLELSEGDVIEEVVEHVDGDSEQLVAGAEASPEADGERVGGSGAASQS